VRRRRGQGGRVGLRVLVGGSWGGHPGCYCSYEHDEIRLANGLRAAYVFDEQNEQQKSDLQPPPAIPLVTVSDCPASAANEVLEPILATLPRPLHLYISRVWSPMTPKSVWRTIAPTSALQSSPLRDPNTSVLLSCFPLGTSPRPSLYSRSSRSRFFLPGPFLYSV
jgi:hypothetical protein